MVRSLTHCIKLKKKKQKKNEQELKELLLDAIQTVSLCNCNAYKP